MKRMVVISDLHCGSEVGITPPKWWWRDDSEEQAKVNRNQKELWNWYITSIEKMKPIDILVVNGDAIDGKGDRSGGTELITTDRIEQCDMAVDVIREADPKTLIMVYGTPYHTGNDEDFERVIIDKVGIDNAHIEGHSFPIINGLQFDIKHKIGSSGVPHGRHTAIARDKLWNTVWASREEQQPKAGVLIRSHVHYHSFCGTPEWLALTTPALQGYGSKYGVRQCSGIVDIGITVFDVMDNGDYVWKCRTARLKQQFVKPLTL